jgi:hypothetical protein
MANVDDDECKARWQSKELVRRRRFALDHRVLKA